MSTNTSPPSQTPTTPSLHTYHCLCATLLLCTPYSIPSLPTRAAPSRDKARILPLPPLQQHKRRPSPPPPPIAKTKDHPTIDTVEEEDDNEDEGGDGEEEDEEEADGYGDGDGEQSYLPSLILPALRPARKIIIVRREDGWERRRVWRCGRCGLGVGYEIEGEGGLDAAKDKGLRVMYLLEGGLVETGDLDGQGGDGLKEKGDVVERAVQGAS